MVLQARKRATLIPAHQARIADNVRGDDRRQSSLLTSQRNSIASPPRIVERLTRQGNDAANVKR